MKPISRAVLIFIFTLCISESELFAQKKSDSELIEVENLHLCLKDSAQKNIFKTARKDFQKCAPHFRSVSQNRFYNEWTTVNEVFVKGYAASLQLF